MGGTATKAASVVQPVERGLERLFRLAREDSLQDMRSKLAAYTGEATATRTVQPIVLQHAAIADFQGMPKPAILVEFDQPDHLIYQKVADRVRTSASSLTPHCLANIRPCCRITSFVRGVHRVRTTGTILVVHCVADLCSC